MTITEGKAAPAFTLVDERGEKVTLRALKGTKILLYFYPRDDTPGCTKEACGFRDLQSRFADQGVSILGISPDNPDKHMNFIEKYDLNFSLLCDPDKAVMAKYGAFGEKMMYGKKTTGVIRSTVLIDEQGKVLKHWPRVQKAAEHPAKVLAFIEEEA